MVISTSFSVFNCILKQAARKRYLHVHHQIQTTMDFFNTIPLPFDIHPRIRRFVIPLLNIFRKIVVKITFFFIVLGSFWFTVSFLNVHLNFRMGVFFYFMVPFPTIFAVFILLESKIKREDINKFAMNIIFVDAIMEQDLHIDLERDVEKRRVRWRLMRWIAIVLLTWIVHINFVQSKLREKNLIGHIGTLFLLYGPNMIVIHLHFYRIVIYVESIRYRYIVVNKCIKTFHNIKEFDFQRKSDEIRDFLNSNESFEKLKNIRRVCRLLYTANQSINDLFGWSTFVCIFQCFLYCTVFLYQFLRYEMTPEARISMWLLSLPVLHNTVSLACACDLTIKEVSSVSF